MEPVTVAKALIINGQDEVLILTVGDYKERPDKAFKPDLPGGRVEQGEAEYDAAAREIKEETGIDVPPGSLRLAFAATEPYPDQGKSATKLLYICHVPDTPEVTISWEHAKFDWVPLDKLYTIELRPFYRQATDYCVAAGLIS